MWLLLLLFASSGSPSNDSLILVRNPEDICLDPADPGPCQQYSTKWFWDTEDESCKEFHYGGCMGNRNNFPTKQQCMKMCRYKLFNPVAVPDICLFDVDQGHCGDERRGQWWWWFNSDSGECEKFFYYGCGGNDNKFYSLHMCRQVCAEKLSPQIACEQCDLRTSFCKSHSKYNYSCECRVGYEKNNYGQCEDIDECRGYTAVCDKNAWCTNTIGSFSCECMAAYRGDGRHCTFVGLGRSTRDCSQCSQYASCESGICKCREGYQGDGYNCTDVNECLRMPYVCDENAECINTNGSFICTCLEGYAGNGYNCTKSKNACLDKFDRVYQETCSRENWRPHYFYDHETRMCQQFWYDGCRGRSRNVFSDLVTCETMCEQSNVLERAEVCWDKFDLNYRNQCLNGQWQQRFYFDHASLTCRQFWFDGCRSDSRNIFDDALTCQWLCEEQPMYKSRACLEQFDERYKAECNGGRWRQQWYFDRQTKHCVSFWYDGCKGDNENIFQDELSCLQTCENPAKKDPRKPWHTNDKHKMKEAITEIYKPNLTDICSLDNPCKNGATCIWAWKKNTHYCKCAAGFTGNDCSEKIDFDPCASTPCKNGATCKAKAEKGSTSHECFCTSGYGGPSCEERPCDKNPCVNNGTCRTTSGFSTYFCDCPAGYGGKHCDVAIGSSPPEERYGKQVEQVSSGKAEWVQQMKKRLGSQKKTTTAKAPAADQPYSKEKSSADPKKHDREEREKKTSNENASSSEKETPEMMKEEEEENGQQSSSEAQERKTGKLPKAAHRSQKSSDKDTKSSTVFDSCLVTISFLLFLAF